MMKTNNRHEAIKRNVMTKIEEGTIKMRPRWRYIAISILAAVSMVGLTVLSSYFAAVLGMWLRIIISAGPAYGVKRNLAYLLSSFPWWALLFTALGVASLIFLMKRIGNLHRLRTLTVAIITILAILVLGSVLSIADGPMHRNSNDRCGFNPSCTSRFMK